jgi:UDP-N-acetylglucosamine 2-epimerase (non-hydrolysing)
MDHRVPHADEVISGYLKAAVFECQYAGNPAHCRYQVQLLEQIIVTFQSTRLSTRAFRLCYIFGKGSKKGWMGNNRLKIMSIVGARPNMMKVAPLLAELRQHQEIEPILVHTGQHYDYSMSQVFFDQLRVPPPDYNLDVGSGTHYEQTAEIIRKFGDLVQQDRPDMVLVAGDVNSTIACALVAAKERIPVAHVEAGLRSFDRSMPEELNRILTDALADLLFTTEESANRNLANEGVAPNKVFFVGNLMIDSLVRALKIARPFSLRSELGLGEKPYAVLTLHRPSNVDNEDELRRTLDAIAELAQRIPVVFPAHPRTARNIEAFGLKAVKAWQGGSIHGPGLCMMPPASYLDFLDLMQHAVMVITDSGGVQEETTFLGVPCLTYRDNTERPITISMGTNRVVGCDPQHLLLNALEVLEVLESAPHRQSRSAPLRPPLWDGRTAPRIVGILKEVWQRDPACAAERVPL